MIDVHNHFRTMRFGSTAKVLAKCMLKSHRISECSGSSLYLKGHTAQRHDRVGCPDLNQLFHCAERKNFSSHRHMAMLARLAVCVLL